MTTSGVNAFFSPVAMRLCASWPEPQKALEWGEESGAPTVHVARVYAMCVPTVVVPLRTLLHYLGRNPCSAYTSSPFFSVLQIWRKAKGYTRQSLHNRSAFQPTNGFPTSLLLDHQPCAQAHSTSILAGSQEPILHACCDPHPGPESHAGLPCKDSSRHIQG
jgi:hypothetical protein